MMAVKSWTMAWLVAAAIPSLIARQAGEFYDCTSLLLYPQPYSYIIHYYGIEDFICSGYARNGVVGEYRSATSFARCRRILYISYTHETRYAYAFIIKLEFYGNHAVNDRYQLKEYAVTSER